jgi:hypothetical protein
METGDQQILLSAVQQVLPALFDGAAVIVAALVTIVLRTIHVKLNSAKNNEQLSLLAQYAEIAVKAAEQSIVSGSGAEKMAYASRFVADAAKAHGISVVSEAMISTVLESAVFSVKSNLKQPEKKGE